METLKSLEESMDESLVPILSPKVGIFRRGKYAAGKRIGKGNAVNEVKRGQVLGYVEQLGTFVPVESPQAGEAVKFLIADGSPVEYRQEVVDLAPFFGGHIIGDSKHA
ncbi:lipoyl-binding domain-containing protein [Haematococcus lacustris]|uniref:Lipoyl-binding domain-containing protein n=1 Tax=Haematococcus lacustris TaxID=44745 RepID=A0A699Z3J3_HAELA|nr:lipoyl-binding domain-containing protein [Haematococcus lacustris]